MRRFIIKSRLGIAAAIILALWILKWLFLAHSEKSVSGNIRVFLDFADLLLAMAAIYFVWEIFRKWRERLLWKIRRRLILANIFIGAIPVWTAIGIFAISTLLYYYQFSYYLISNQINIHTAQIHNLNNTLKNGMQELMMGASPPDAAVLNQAIDAYARDLLASYQSYSIIFRSNQAVIYVDQNRNPVLIQEYQTPKWLDRDFSGLVMEDLQPQFHKRNLLLRSYVVSDFRRDLPFSIEISVPLDGFFLSILKAAVGQEIALARHVSSTGWMAGLQNSDISKENIIDSTFDKQNISSFKSYLWPMFLYPTSWKNNQELKSGESLNVELSALSLIRNLSRSKNDIGKNLLGILKGIIGLFLIVEILSAVIGILLTKSITNAVHSLDRGTEYIKQGDFSHRIVVQSKDQLGALASSFNQMTEDIQRLLKESIQKERLERELEIAKEVQQRLFPSQNPRMGQLNVSGICLPARIVSGDYYDFLPLGANELGLAIADICGKGISAALLMSSLHATLRSDVINLWRKNGDGGEKMLSGIVEMLNGQIYEYTSDNKFATFFYAVYDDLNRSLTYCNAGHNPPLYFDGKNFKQLRTGGTVIGIFADSKYEQETIALNPGDFLIAYTDGITESLNEKGEEFGEDRLIQVIQKNSKLDADQMKSEIVKEVLSWTYAEERQDDMTLVVAKMSKASGA